MSLECFFVCLITEGLISRVWRENQVANATPSIFSPSVFLWAEPLCFCSVSPLESELNLLNSFVHKESSYGSFSYQLEKDRSFKKFRAASETQIVLGDVAYPKEFCPLKLFKAKG